MLLERFANRAAKTDPSALTDAQILSRIEALHEAGRIVPSGRTVCTGNFFTNTAITIFKMQAGWDVQLSTGNPHKFLMGPILSVVFDKTTGAPSREMDAELIESPYTNHRVFDEDQAKAITEQVKMFVAKAYDYNFPGQTP